MGHSPKGLSSLGGFILGLFVSWNFVPGRLLPEEARPLKIAHVGVLFV